MFKYSSQNIPSLWVSRLKSFIYLIITFASPPPSIRPCFDHSEQHWWNIIYYGRHTVLASQFLCQQRVQNHSKSYTILILTKILAILLLLYRTHPAVSLLQYQFQAFQFPMHPPIYCLCQLNIPLDASHRPVPWLFSSILSTLVYTLCYTIQSAINSTSKFYVTFRVISMQSS
jgi:hypothetical protein